MSYLTDAAAARVGVSARVRPGHMVGRDPEVIYLRVTTADGARRVLVDGLGSLWATASGWSYTVPGYGAGSFETRDEALAEVRALLGDVDSEDPA